MKKSISFALIILFLLSLCTFATAENSPLGLYSMIGEYIGIGMQRSEIESILGKPLNNPFLNPEIVEDPFTCILWDSSNPFARIDPDYNIGYYCVYAGNTIIQYDYGFAWEEFEQESTLQLYNEMLKDFYKYDKSEWEALLPEMIALNDKYATIAESSSTAILISTTDFEFSTHDNIYVGKNEIGEYWSFSHSYQDIEEFYFVNQDQYRKLESEQVDASLSTGKYVEKDFVGVGISVRDNDGMVEEICIKRLDAGNATDPCDVMNQYEDFLRYSIHLPN